MATVRTINEIKASLSKELPADDLSDDSVERCLDMFRRLDECQVDLEILSKTLIGTVVSKFKTHGTLGPLAKNLVKKWKKAARGAADSSTPTSTKKEARGDVHASTDNSKGDPISVSPPEWDELPPLRQNIVKKLHSLLELSRTEMVEAGVSREAFQDMSVSCATEIELAIQHKHGNDRAGYGDKSRSLCFNMKKNSELRSNLLMGSISADELVVMSSEDLATSAKTEARNAEVKKLRDSRLLDWEQQNEGKINEMCGIKGDLLQASLFTCGRCKSVKTTSTQKQTRSADEPMTVFVLCLNCGKRWKC